MEKMGREKSPGGKTGRAGEDAQSRREAGGRQEVFGWTGPVAGGMFRHLENRLFFPGRWTFSTDFACVWRLSPQKHRYLKKWEGKPLEFSTH
jgi:hypothetical protein